MSSGFEGANGPWHAVQLDERGGGWWVVSTDPDGYKTVDESGDGGFEEGTARFIAEAGMVLHETGLTPRQLAEQRAELLEALRGLYDELERDHYGAGYAPEPDEPMGIAKAALATQRKEPGA